MKKERTRRLLTRRNDFVDSFFQLNYSNTHLLYFIFYLAQINNRLIIELTSDEIQTELNYIKDYRLRDMIIEFAALSGSTEFFIKDFDDKTDGYKIIYPVESATFDLNKNKLTVKLNNDIRKYLFDLDDNCTSIDIDVLKNITGMLVQEKNVAIKGYEYFKSRFDYYNEKTVYLAIKKDFLMVRLFPFFATEEVRNAFLKSEGEKEAIQKANNLDMPDFHPYLWAAFRKNYLKKVLNYINDNTQLNIEYKMIRKSYQVSAVLVKIKCGDDYIDNSQGRKFNDQESIFNSLAAKEFETSIRHPAE